MGRASRSRWERRLAAAEARAINTSKLDDTPWERFLRFAENGMTMTTIGIVGSLGTIFYRPCAILCIILFALGLHRSKAIKGLSLKAQITCYVCLMLALGVLLYTLDRAIERHKEHIPTVKEIWEGHDIPLSPAPIVNNYRTTLPPREENHGEVEVYFGDPSSRRGSIVAANSSAQKEAAFAKAKKGGMFNTTILPEYVNQQFQEIPIKIRNSGNGAIQNVSVEISANIPLDTVTEGAHHGNNAGTISFDVSEVPPYSTLAQETLFVIKIRNEARTFTPTAIIVTVRGKGLKSPHSEIMKYVFLPLPS